MQKIVLLFGAILFIGIVPLNGQTVKVLNETNLQPVEDVFIYNQDNKKSVSTNADGMVDISHYGPSDYLTFQHPAFKRLVLSYEEVENRDFTVKLVERSVVMEEIYVSASKREQDQTEIPQKIMQINQQQVSFNNPQTSADLLQSSGKVFVQKSQLGGGSPMIRGFAANSVLIAVDGIRMNTAIFRSGNLQNVISVDPNVLEQTEVIYGPGSIIYGSDALGGVMNFQTKDPQLSFSEQNSFNRVNSMVRYSSANNERTVHADWNLGYEKWGFLSSVTYSNFDDLRSGGNFYDEYPDFGKREEYVIRSAGTDQVVDNEDVTIQKFSGYEQLNLMQKVRYNPTGMWNINLGMYYSTTTDIPRYDRLIQRENGDTGQLKNAEWYYGPQVWMLNSLEVENVRETGLYNKVSGVVSYQWFQESRNDRDLFDSNLRNREENINVVTANIDFDKQWGESRELYYGLETVYNSVSSEASSKNINTGSVTPVATRYPDGGSDYTQLAAYTKYEHDFSDKLTAITGARYSHVMLESRFINSQYYDPPGSDDTINLNTGAISGSLGFTYRPVNSLQFNFNASTGFRAPNVDDVAKVFDSEPGTVIVPNDNVSPEYAYNLDFAVIKNFGTRARLEVNTFYTWLKDAMVRRAFSVAGQDSIMYDGQLSKVEAIVNAGRAYLYGVSGAVTAEFNDHLSVESSITITEGYDSTNDEPLRHVAPVFGRTSLIYKAEKIRAELYSEYNAKKPISDFSPSEKAKKHLYTNDGTPGWTTLNIKGSYQLNEHFQLNLGVENILDKHYRPYSSGISAAGRNVILALRATI